ncbi:MAG: transcriptional regulator NrdR [Victivallales bacterium]|nr:transcriptional regulator NrdR [Victivallales bacterium]
MKCPKCDCKEDKVVDSRLVKEGKAVRRRRECLNCQQRFTTYEEIIQSEISVIKRNKSRQEFERAKLRNGIKNACWKRPISDEKIDELVDKVTLSLEHDFDREVSSRVIGERTMSELKKFDEVAYVRFASVYRDFKDIERFIEEIRLLNKAEKE